MLPPSTLPPLSLYIHLPWCVQKCPYCDFNSHQWRGEDWQAAEQGYLIALRQDLQNALPQVWGRRLISIFIGGGTPSLFSPEAIFDLLSTLRSLFAFSPQIEVTMEANPNSAEVARFAAWRDAGINRLSIGIQSFNPTFLERLGRAHGRREALLAAEQATRHFSNFNLDLMYALPGQRLEAQIEDLETALSFQPPHLSCYQLTIEAQTAFAKAPPPDLPDEDASYRMEEALQQRLQAVGYQRYEISAYSRGQRCQHNLNYWQFGDYLGVGAGAHSKLTCWESGQWRVERQIRLKHPYRYMEALAAEKTAMEQSETVGEDALVFEFMLNALRLPEGFASSAFREHTGLDLTLAASALAKAEEKGLLERSPQWIRPTPLGLRFLNDLQTLFLPSAQGRGRRAIPIQPVA